MKINCLDSLHKNYKGAKEKCCGSIFFLCRTVAMETIFRGQLAAIPVQHKKNQNATFRGLVSGTSHNYQHLKCCCTLTTAKYWLVLLGAKLI